MTLPDSIIEKVARAIYDAEPIREPEDDGTTYVPSWDDVRASYAATHEATIELATAALTASGIEEMAEALRSSEMALQEAANVLAGHGFPGLASILQSHVSKAAEALSHFTNDKEGGE